MSRPVAIFAGGGTGGHIFPGVAIAEHLEESVPGCELHFVCSVRPGDAAMLKATGRPFSAIAAQPFGLRPRSLLRFLGSWGESVRAMRGLIAAKRTAGPVVVVAMGGFVAAPAAQAARAERVPVVLVNLDAVPGRANRWIARHARRVLTAAKVPGSDWEYVRPIIRRSAMAPGDRATCRRMFNLDAGRTTLLVTGASLGARTINEFMLAWVERHAALLRGWQVIHQTGQGEHEALVLAGVPSREIGDGKRDDEAGRDGDDYVQQRPQDGREVEVVGADQTVPHDSCLRELPLQRIPDGHGRAEDGIDGPEGDAEHDVERDQEEQDDPHHRGEPEHGPEEPRGAIAHLRTGLELLPDRLVLAFDLGG